MRRKKILKGVDGRKSSDTLIEDCGRFETLSVEPPPVSQGNLAIR